METIYLKKQTRSNGAVYVASAVGIKTREGLRLIPHPYGTETVAYEDLETAIAQIHRAGYAVEFDGKYYPLPTIGKISAPRLKGRSTPVSSVMQIVEEAIPLLHQQLGDSVPSVVASAAFALGEIKDERAIPALIHAFSNEDAAVRKNVAEALAKIGKPALHAIQLALKDKHWLIRHTALATLLELIHTAIDLVPAILPNALPLLKDESWLVRSQAAVVFGEAAKALSAYQEKDYLALPGEGAL